MLPDRVSNPGPLTYESWIAWWTIATGIMTVCSLFGWSTATEPRLPADLIETVSKHNTSATPAALMS